MKLTDRLEVKEIRVKSVLTKSKLPESQYSINPYIGCYHSCVYCYSRFMRRFTGHSDEKWGSFVDVKVNAAEVLRHQLSRRKPEGVILLGSVTDAYQPLERKYRITRSILKVLLKHQLQISILTKSDLVLRDLDLLKQFDSCDVGLTITTLDENVRRHFEPRSSSVERRIDALKELHESGLHTYVFIGPILPYLTEIRPILSAVRSYVDSVWAEALNIRCGNWSDIEDVLRDSFPELLSKFKKTIQDKNYWDRVGNELKELAQEFQIPLVGYYRH